jgi:hypothetical protein
MSKNQAIGDDSPKCRRPCGNLPDNTIRSLLNSYYLMLRTLIKSSLTLHDEKRNGLIEWLPVKPFCSSNSNRGVEFVDGSLSHDNITRMLSGNTCNSKNLWQKVKPLVRQYESEEACLIFDDTIVSKPYTNENDLISWHRDHSKGHNEKGINLLTAFYHTQWSEAAEALRVPPLSVSKRPSDSAT